METIYKYELAITDNQVVQMPIDAKILTVQTQHGKPWMWALVNPEYPLVKRNFETYGTGHRVPTLGITYIGTYQVEDGSLVFHVFEALG